MNNGSGIAARIKARTRTLSADEWIITAVTASVVLPDPAVGVIVGLAALFALIHPARRKKLAAMPAFWATLVMLPLCVLPGVLKGYLIGALGGVVVWLIMVYLLYLSSVMTLRFFSNLMDELLAVSVAAMLYGLFCKWQGILELGRVASIFENPNYYGCALEFFVLIAACQYCRKSKPVYLVLLAMNVLCNIMCDSRTAWVAMLASVAVFAFLRIRKFWLLCAAGGAAALLFFVLQFVPGVGARLTLEAIGRSLGNRMIYWGNAWDWIKQSPLFGYGVLGYRMLSQLHGERVLVHAHNLYLNMVLDIGAVGTLGFLWLAVGTLSPVVRRKRSPRYECADYLVIASIAAILVHGITDLTTLGVSTALLKVGIMSGAWCRHGDLERSIKLAET